METRVTRFCNRFIEAGWLLAVVLVPVFFNVRTFRVFEPDKGALLCGLALVMAAAWLAKSTEGAVYWLGGQLGLTERSKAERSRRLMPFYLSVIPFVLFAAVFLASAATSMHPRISLVGSYQRGQGAFLVLALAVMALLVATHLRTRTQVGRLLAAVALGSLPVTFYAVMQAAGADPLPWGSPEPIVASTLGNADFLAGYLVVVIPLTVAGLLALSLAARRAWQDFQEGIVTTSPLLLMIGYGLPLLGGLPVLGLQVYALALSGGHTASLALLTAAMPAGLLLVALFLRRSRQRRVLLVLASVLTVGVLLSLMVISFADVSIAEWRLARSDESDPAPTLVVRQLIWEGARELLFTRPPVGSQPDSWSAMRPLLGYGPEMMQYAYHQVYQPEMGRYESRNAAPDHAFNQLLDVGVTLGWIGLATFLLLLVAFLGVALAAIATAVVTGRKQGAAVVVAGVLWAGLAYFVEAQFSIATIPGQLLFWIGLGTMAALTCLREEMEVGSAAWPLASGVPLLLLPSTALVVTTLSGFASSPQFMRGLQENGGLFLVMLGGLGLAVAAATNSAAERRESRQHSWATATGLLVVLALGLFAITCLVVKELMSTPVIGPSSDLFDLDGIRRYTQMALILSWGTILLGLLAVALSLPRSSTSPTAWDQRHPAALATAAPVVALIVVGTTLLILNVSVRPIQADIIFKMGNTQARTDWPTHAADLYRLAIDLAPQEGFYHIFLGRLQLEQAQKTQDPAGRQAGLAMAWGTLARAQTLNPLNPDHVANLARFHRMTATLEGTSTAQETSLRAADDYYRQVTTLAPRQPVLWNEWATLQRDLMHDLDQACRLLERSLALDPEFEQTLQLYAETCPQALPVQPRNLGFEGTTH